MKYKQAIVVRTDLDMGRGKMCAQAAHASVSVLEKVDKKVMSAWKKDGQKKVVLRADGEELKSARKRCDEAGVPSYLVSDSGLTQLEPGTVTALAIGPDEEDKIDSITGEMKLL